MRVALVVQAYYSRDSRVRRYAELLAAKGHRVDCIALAENYIPRKNISLIGIPLTRCRRGKLRYLIEYSLFFLFAAWHLSGKKYDMVHVNNMPEALVFAAAVAKWRGAQVILDIHDPTPELFMSKYGAAEQSPSVRFLKMVEHHSLDFADRVITANCLFRDLLLERNRSLRPEKISIILNCPDSRLFGRRRQKHGRFNIVYMGTVEERLAVAAAVEAMPLVAREIPEARLLLIPKLETEGDYLRQLKKRILMPDLAGLIRLMPPQPLEKIARLLKQADVGVVLSKRDAYTDMIFPLKLLEFIQAGVPVIAVKTRLLGLSFSNRELLFLKEAAPAQLAKHIIALYRDPALRERYARNAGQYLKEHNWAQEKINYLSLIRHPA